MRISHNQSEKGVALALAILALLLLSGVAIGMMYMSSTETAVSANFKGEETEYFAARAGAEEVRDRMLPASPNTINDYLIVNSVDTCQVSSKCLLPTALPGNTNFGSGAPVLYILQSGISMSDVTSFSTNSKCPANATGASCLVDDELCHDYPGFGGMSSNTASNIRCTSLPSGSAWYPSTPPASAAPYALDWKWVRVTLKANNSAPYTVDSSKAAGGLVCWNGSSEVVTVGTTVSSVNNSPCGNLVPMANPVYMVTALAVNANGARRLVQQEIAQNPITGQPGGLFADGSGCNNPLTLGGNITTYSFNSSTESTPSNPPSNVSTTGGDVGANGSVAVNGTSAAVNGTISSTYPASTGSCPQNAVSVSGNPTIGSQAQMTTAYSPPTPAYPNPMPPQTSCCSSSSLTPGSYGDISLSGHNTLTLQGGTAGNPAVYNINSITETGQSSVVISPAGPVILNVAGQNQATPISLAGGGFANNTYIPSDFIINYPGTGAVVLTGGSGAYFVLNAPNASVTLQGNASFYGQALGQTINVLGNPNFYWDKAASTPSTNNSPYYEISLRELSY